MTDKQEIMVDLLRLVFRDVAFRDYGNFSFNAGSVTCISWKNKLVARLDFQDQTFKIGKAEVDLPVVLDDKYDFLAVMMEVIESPVALQSPPMLVVEAFSGALQIVGESSLSVVEVFMDSDTAGGNPPPGAIYVVYRDPDAMIKVTKDEVHVVDLRTENSVRNRSFPLGLDNTEQAFLWTLHYLVPSNWFNAKAE